MSVQERNERERAHRHHLIVEAARELAESDGWDAVTTRRLAERTEAREGEPIRGVGPAALGEVPADPLRTYRGSGQLLSVLGQEVEEEIDELATALAGEDPPGEDYLAKVGRLNRGT